MMSLKQARGRPEKNDPHTISLVSTMSEVRILSVEQRGRNSMNVLINGCTVGKLALNLIYTSYIC
jgi:hypothetical protein